MRQAKLIFTNFALRDAAGLEGSSLDFLSFPDSFLLPLFLNFPPHFASSHRYLRRVATKLPHLATKKLILTALVANISSKCELYISITKIGAEYHCVFADILDIYSFYSVVEETKFAFCL